MTESKHGASALDKAKDWLANLTPKERELIERCTCDLARPYWHSFHREGCPLAR
jgi:hypothetical protein